MVWRGFAVDRHNRILSGYLQVTRYPGFVGFPRKPVYGPSVGRCPISSVFPLGSHNRRRASGLVIIPERPIVTKTLAPQPPTRYNEISR